MLFADGVGYRRQCCCHRYLQASSTLHVYQILSNRRQQRVSHLYQHNYDSLKLLRIPHVACRSGERSRSAVCVLLVSHWHKDSFGPREPLVVRLHFTCMRRIHMPWSLLPRTLHSHAHAPQPQAIALFTYPCLPIYLLCPHPPLPPSFTRPHPPEKHQTSTTSTHLPTTKHTHYPLPTTHPSTCPLSGALRTRLGYVDHSSHFHVAYDRSRSAVEQQRAFHLTNMIFSQSSFSPASSRSAKSKSAERSSRSSPPSSDQVRGHIPPFTPMSFH
jgi:hypothetical protein